MLYNERLISKLNKNEKFSDQPSIESQKSRPVFKVHKVALANVD